jgi:hypothetical protein
VPTLPCWRLNDVWSSWRLNDVWWSVASSKKKNHKALMKFR